MIVVLDSVLSAPEVAAVRDIAASLDFADGKATAGRFAKAVKANHQAAPSAERDAVLEKARQALLAHAVFSAAARPRQFTPMILSRYREGETYGSHVDDALMGGLRTDLSFTLFLSDPEAYEGGALVIEDEVEERAIRLSAGSAILYPSTSLHRVAPVTSGERLAVVGWVESWIRSAEEREILFDLERVVQAIHATEGKSVVFDLVSKTRSNLLRMWAGK